MKFASICFAIALLTLPAGSALKLMFGSRDSLWIDPTLIFSLLSFCALAFVWSNKDLDRVGECCVAVLVLCLLCIACSFSGLLFRKPEKLYDILREPIRFFLLMIWMITSYWFLQTRRRFVFRCATAAVTVGIASGIYVELVAIGVLGAPEQAVQYARVYMIRQVLWYHGTLIPRMGGFFVEAPPFGLFMLGMGILFFIARRAGIRGKTTMAGLILSAMGVVLSMADQVLLGLSVCFGALMLTTQSQRRWIKPVMLMVLGGILLTAGWHSLQTKVVAGADTSNIRHIYQNSVGERAFHFEYGMSLFLRQPVGSFLGVGPGRYGEYVAETGYFPDSVTMQSTEPEILVEWGVLGAAVWLLVLAAVAVRIWKLHGLAGVGLLLGLILANSFQANWKSEAAFLAIAALCVPALASRRDSVIGSPVLPWQQKPA